MTEVHPGVNEVNAVTSHGGRTLVVFLSHRLDAYMQVWRDSYRMKNRCVTNLPICFTFVVMVVVWNSVAVNGDFVVDITSSCGFVLFEDWWVEAKLRRRQAVIRCHR